MLRTCSDAVQRLGNPYSHIRTWRWGWNRLKTCFGGRLGGVLAGIDPRNTVELVVETPALGEAF